jgi:hypothetical protein
LYPVILVFLSKAFKNQQLYNKYMNLTEMLAEVSVKQAHVISQMQQTYNHRNIKINK